MNRDDFFFLVISKLRFPIIFLVVIYTIGILGLILIPGIDNNGNEYQMGIFDALFIVIYTSTTVGFGEMPYAWTYAQKFWMAIITILSVTAWLVSIGQIILILQDKHIRIKKNIHNFHSNLKKTKNSFYIVCGFGNTGKSLTKLMKTHGSTIVIIDKNQDVVDAIEFNDFSGEVLSICGDINDLEYLKLIGVCNPYCQGIILTTNDDNANTQAALSSKILNPSLKVISRTTNAENKRNLESFGTDYVISPYMLFCNDIYDMLFNKNTFKIKNLLTNEDFNFNTQSIPKGNWIVVRQSSYGKLLNKKLKKENINISIIDKDIDKNIDRFKSDRYIKGLGVDEIDLKQAKIDSAAVLVLTHEDDFINLSSIITAKRLNEKIFTIAIVNNKSNKILFEKIGVDVIFHPYELMVRKIFSLVSEPLLHKFFKNINKKDEEFKSCFLSKIENIPEKDLILWHINLDENHSPAIYNYIEKNKTVKIKDIVLNKKYYKINTIPLLIIKGDKEIIMPTLETNLEYDDIILFAGNKNTKCKMEWIINNVILFENNYIREKNEENE